MGTEGFLATPIVRDALAGLIGGAVPGRAPARDTPVVERTACRFCACDAAQVSAGAVGPLSWHMLYAEIRASLEARPSLFSEGNTNSPFSSARFCICITPHTRMLRADSRMRACHESRIHWLSCYDACVRARAI